MDALPGIVGVELTGKLQPGITATDMNCAGADRVPAQAKVVGLAGFYGRRRCGADLGRPREPFPTWPTGDTVPRQRCFIDQQTINYLKLTGREDQQELQLVEQHYAKRSTVYGAGSLRARSTSAA